MVIKRLHIRTLEAQRPDFVASKTPQYHGFVASKTPNLKDQEPKVQNMHPPLHPLPLGDLSLH